eukprot:1468053-Rhodomonas_salina.2
MCDDGNRVDGDGCDSTCILTPERTPEPVRWNFTLEFVEVRDVRDMIQHECCTTSAAPHTQEHSVMCSDTASA